MGDDMKINVQGSGREPFTLGPASPVTEQAAIITAQERRAEAGGIPSGVDPAVSKPSKTDWSADAVENADRLWRVGPQHAYGCVCDNCHERLKVIAEQLPRHAPIDWESRCRQVEAERDAAVARALTSERFRAEDAASQMDDQMMHIRRWQKAEASLATVTAELTEARSARERAEQALTKLVNEVRGVLGIAEPELRDAVGHTNVNVLVQRLTEARHILTPPVPPSATPDEVKE